MHKPKMSRRVDVGLERVIALLNEDVDRITAGGVNPRGYRHHGMNASAWNSYLMARSYINELAKWRRSRKENPDGQ